MIRVGLDLDAKKATVARYVDEHRIQRVVVIAPERFPLACSMTIDAIEWDDVIRYKTYYRLLQEIDKSTLVVLHECLRTQNRHDLSYNCIRSYLNQTDHQIVFQTLPIISTVDDLSILVDFDTRSRWKRDKLRPEMLRDLDVQSSACNLTLDAIRVTTDAKTKTAYEREKRTLIDGIGQKDPHTIPRQLHLLSGKAKLAHVDRDVPHVGRNNRFGLPNLVTYREASARSEHHVFEFCHNEIDFADFLAATGQQRVRALVSDLRVDTWYFDRYQQWLGRVREAHAILRG